MVDVPEHLAPSDGLTNSRLRYRGLDAHDKGGGATHRFEICDEEGDLVGTYTIDVRPTGVGTVDSQIAEAHRQMINVLRQWLFETELMRKHYDRTTDGAKTP